MPKKAKELSALAVSKLKNPGRYAVGGVDGLHLNISPTGWKRWMLRVQVEGGKRRDIGLGGFSMLSLAEARAQAYELRKQIKSGADPVQERRERKVQARLEAEKQKTFKECAEAYIKVNEVGWKSKKHAQQWFNTLASYAFPKIGELPVAAIDTGMVLGILQQPVDNGAPFWHAKTETASRLRGRIETVLDWAAFRGYRTGENPARWKGHLEYELPASNKVKKIKHHSALPYMDVQAFMSALRQRPGVSARAVEFGILTAARSNEIRGMRWSDVDNERGLWIIPAERMKMGREHRIPLSVPALRLLDEMHTHAETDLVFPRVRGGQLSDMSLTLVLRRMDEARMKSEQRGWRDRKGDVITMHGFRSTFRDWAGETTAYPREVCEHALAHKLADEAEAAYQRGDFLEKRVGLMADWGRFCDAAPGEG